MLQVPVRHCSANGSAAFVICNYGEVSHVTPASARMDRRKLVGPTTALEKEVQSNHEYYIIYIMRSMLPVLFTGMHVEPDSMVSV